MSARRSSAGSPPGTPCPSSSSAPPCALAGVYSALTISSSVFPQTDFPRVVILVDNGVMPADEMMATITRPIEEAMKDIRGVVDDPFDLRAAARPRSASFSPGTWT